MPTPSRDGLAALYGTGRQTFYARFQRYGVKALPETSKLDAVSSVWRTLLIHVMDENMHLVADHVWCDLPKKKNECKWALPQHQPLRLEASVGRYVSNIWDAPNVKYVSKVSYNFAVIWKYEKLKHFPIETPEMVEGYHHFFNHIIADPKLLKIWVESRPFVTSIPYPKFEIS